MEAPNNCPYCFELISPFLECDKSDHRFHFNSKDNWWILHRTSRIMANGHVIYYSGTDSVVNLIIFDSVKSIEEVTSALKKILKLKAFI